MDVDRLAATLSLGSLLDALREEHGYRIVAHWSQGEFHHDLLLQVGEEHLVVATNCNGGVKEVLRFARAPERGALWRWRCPASTEFSGELPPLLGRAVTPHWFDPCDLLRDDARSELRPDARDRQRGGGWCRRPGRST